MVYASRHAVAGHGLRQRQRVAARAGCSLLLVLTLCWWAAGAPAAESGAVNMKLMLVQQYLSSSTAGKIRESGNPEAIRLLDRTAELFEQANAASSDDPAAAEEFVAQALRSFSSASTAMARGQGDPDQARKRNEQLLSEIGLYRESFNESLRQKGPAFATLLDADRLDSLLAEAGSLQGEGRHADATKPLQAAYDMTVAAVTRLRANENVVYALEFRTPADEFRYEENRNQSYELLVERMVASGAAEGSAGKLVERFVQEGRRLKSAAADEAARGDFEKAIETMEDANKNLVRALQMMGMPIPG